MKLNDDQVETINNSLLKLSALAYVIDYLCDAGTPPDDVMSGWGLLLSGIKDEIERAIEPAKEG